MAGFRYADGTAVQVGDRVRLEDYQWHGVVERCVDDPQAPSYERGVLVRYDEVGHVLYSDEIEQDVVLVSRAPAS